MTIKNETFRVDNGPEGFKIKIVIIYAFTLDR